MLATTFLSCSGAAIRAVSLCCSLQHQPGELSEEFCSNRSSDPHRIAVRVQLDDVRTDNGRVHAVNKPENEEFSSQGTPSSATMPGSNRSVET